jgi:pimeloyl-ACP methyl ester carboxylesterase
MKRFLGILALLLGLSVLFLWGWPLNLGPVQAVAAGARPAVSYEEAVARLASLPADGQEGNTAVLNPVCPTQLRTHGQPTPRVIVIFHGYTTCPAQWNELADDLFAQGHNLLIVRLPYHGYQDRLTHDLELMTAEQLAHTATEAVDIAQALGDSVTVVGFSTGGTMASWLAQHRADIDRTVIISPFYSLVMFPAWLSRPLATLTRTLPNFYLWWNPEVQDNDPNSPPYAYPHFSTRAMGEIYRLGYAVRELAPQEPVLPPHIMLILNPTDDAVLNEISETVFAQWQQTSPSTTLENYTFDTAFVLPHDYIDPFPPTQKTEITYPILLALILGD